MSVSVVARILGAVTRRGSATALYLAIAFALVAAVIGVMRLMSGMSRTWKVDSGNAAIVLRIVTP
jgi:hypothetical protein